ncbi:hypothetical protein [Rhodococcoides fascians]|uniref:hypothetical protein n=1 Tax=Rhodococcoides fascians TaxID=1828 RepID=UPI00278897C8|nr:hypothetical protein [Rhodococcus fascians]MDQ0283797.1 transcriptional regulator with XRE-family HTH domain [Rhodococcus fascians]
MTDRPSLAELIETAAKRHNGASGRRLAEIAQAGKHDVSHATLNRIRTGKYSSRPSDSTLRAIAFLAGVDEEDAFVAADLAAATETDTDAEAAARERKHKRLALAAAFSSDRVIWILSHLDLDDPDTMDTLVDALDPHITTVLDLAEEIYGGRDDLEEAMENMINPAPRDGFAVKANEMGRRAKSAPALTREDQGAQPDYDLARRKGETESEWRRRTQPQPEDENQDSPTQGEP